MKIPSLLSDILLVSRWTLIHLAVFGFCSYTAMDNSYEDGWPDYSLIARVLSLPVSLLGTYKIPLVLGNSLLWGLAVLALRKFSKHPLGQRITKATGYLFFFGALYTFLLKGLIYLLGKGLPIAHRDDLLRDSFLIQLFGFPTIQISDWSEIPLRLPLTFCLGMVLGGIVLVVWRWRRG